MLKELLEASFDHQTDNMYTALPGIIVTVRDELNNLSVDVQPTLNIKDRDGTITERTAVLNVPIQMPSSSTAALTYPVNVGDPVLLVYTMTGMDTWKRGNGRPSVPSDFRKFDKRDCVAIPGIWPFSRSVNNPSVRVWAHDTGDLVIVNNIGGTENEVRLKKSGDIVINTNQNVEVNCRNAQVNAMQGISLSSQTLSIDAVSADISIGNTTWNGNITHAGNYNVTGSATFNGILFDTHGHTGVTPGTGTSGGPV